MTPKEKAKELLDKFLQYTPVEFEEEYAKQCALIAVDEIIKTGSLGSIYEGWWQQVRTEIQNL